MAHDNPYADVAARLAGSDNFTITDIRTFASALLSIAEVAMPPGFFNSDSRCPWWEQHGGKSVAYLMAMYELPELLCGQLLAHALRATFAIASATLGERRRTHVEIAAAAALWVRGYAEARGWTPPTADAGQTTIPEGATSAGH